MNSRLVRSPVLLCILALIIPVSGFVWLMFAPALNLPVLSEKALVQHYQMQISPGEEQPLYYLNYLPDSARYYAQGNVAKIDAGGKEQVANGAWLAVHRTQGDVSDWPCRLAFQPETGVFDLYYCDD